MPRRLKDDRQKRNRNGSFLRQCGSLIHSDDDLKVPLKLLFLKDSDGKVKKVVKDKLISKGIIKKWTKWISPKCIDLVENNTELHKILPSISSDLEDEDDLRDSLDSEDNLIDEPNSKDDLTDLCIEVGSRLSKLVSEDIGNLAAQKISVLLIHFRNMMSRLG